MRLLAIKKYIRIYLSLLKYSFITAAMYHTSFLIQIFVELGYSFSFILFFHVLYSNVQEIAGWTYNEMLFLLGLGIVTSEFLLGAVTILNLRDLPQKIKDGEIDFVLLKPVNSLFYLSLGKPYFTSLIAAIPGFYIMHQSFWRSGVELSILNLASFIILFLCGIVISFAMLVIISSLSFVFINSSFLPRVGESIFFIKRIPHQAYKGLFKILFFYVFPVAFVCSIPSSAVLRGVEPKYILQAFVLAILFLFFCVKIWNMFIKRYRSASS